MVSSGTCVVVKHWVARNDTEMGHGIFLPGMRWLTDISCALRERRDISATLRSGDINRIASVLVWAGMITEGRLDIWDQQLNLGRITGSFIDFS
jgi:hypothetical protein